MSARKATYPVLDLIINRLSPRAMSGEAISHQELMSLFEAARWAPSSFNNQPWRFIYAHRDTEHWPTLFDLMVPFNQEWTKRAAVLILILSDSLFAKTGKPSRTHSFDTGAAWENMALQASSMHLVIHGMEGFDYDKARANLNVPTHYTVEALVAVGKPASISILSPELQQKEVLSDRNPVSDFVYEGTFPKII
jgi:nitroreductase